MAARVKSPVLRLVQLGVAALIRGGPEVGQFRLVHDRCRPAWHCAPILPWYPSARKTPFSAWFIAWAELDREELSNLKLQKLLYYAQGHYLGERCQPLFADEIQAWSHGPVVPPVYHEYKSLGSATIELPQDDPFTWDDIDGETGDFLGRVWNTYGRFSAGHLREMTHEETPWRAHFRPDERFIAIPQAEVQRYFARRSVAGAE